jgi:hypothetical protein
MDRPRDDLRSRQPSIDAARETGMLHGDVTEATRDAERI